MNCTAYRHTETQTITVIFNDMETVAYGGRALMGYHQDERAFLPVADYLLTDGTYQKIALTQPIEADLFQWTGIKI